MKKLTLFIALSLINISIVFAQATDFTTDDCNGITHNLFDSLDAGNVIVISWVMPCGPCATYTIPAYAAVQSFASSHPGQVDFYLVDDYANTPCPTLVNWGNSNNMPLNTAFSSEGAYIHIPKNKLVEKPIQIIHFSTGNESALMLQPRNLVVVDENSHVQIIERHQSLTSNAVLTNSVTEIFANKRAIVDYYKVQNDHENASLIDNTFIHQKRESHASVHTFTFGGNLTRNNLNFYQHGERVDSTLKGITIIGDKQHVDHNTLVHHVEPNCESHQDYKGIFNDKSTGVFNGKVIVEKEAQKTNAFQANNNILVSDQSAINTKPQLEIFADDVKCSHGCTIGQLDTDALFYMKTRGIPEKEAKALLMYAFANNVLESVKIATLKTRINKLIANKIGVNIGFNL